MRKITVIIVLCLCMFGALMLGFLVFGRAESVTLGNAHAEAIPGSPARAHVYLQIKNGNAPDQLLGASSSEAEQIVFIGARGNESLPIPSNGTAILSSDGVHLLLVGLEGTLDEGRLIPIALEFARSGRVTTRAEIKPSGNPHEKHDMLAMETDMVGPSLEMEVTAEDGGGWNVHLTTKNFIFDPETIAPVHVPGHGHGHLYINGLKIQRMYSETATIGALPPGTYEVLVTLNTNTHAPYTTISGEPVIASETISIE